MEQGRRLLVWFEANYKKLAVALGGAFGLVCCTHAGHLRYEAQTTPCVHVTSVLTYPYVL